MRKNGFYGIGIYKPKKESNWGTLFRTAQVFDANFLFMIGQRYRRHPSDTAYSARHIPVYEYIDWDDFISHMPIDCTLIGIEMTYKAMPLSRFVHPKRAIYLLGAEDSGLPITIQNDCQALVYLPGDMCLNVSIAGSIVLYDRLAKKRKGDET